MKNNREDAFQFAEKIYDKLKNLTLLTKTSPNSYFYSIWKLEAFLMADSKHFKINNL